MAVKTTLIIQARNQNAELVERAVGYINPAITDENANTVARALNGLTTNSYVDAIRRDEKSINEALEG